MPGIVKDGGMFGPQRLDIVKKMLWILSVFLVRFFEPKLS